MTKTYYVAKQGKDAYAGSFERPLLTIQEAANRALPGDTIVVREGVYRESVNPVCGGTDDLHRITYQAYEGERVVISGAEPVTSWQQIEGSVYKAVVDNAMFGEFNPYKEVVWGDWFESPRVDHQGEVYISGRSMFEVNSLDEVLMPTVHQPARDQAWSLHTWYCEVEEQSTTIYANFQAFDPQVEMIEINVRKNCFWPTKNGVDYITVRGFEMTMAATNWAPPSALQEGLIGPHWSKGWIIEHNTISNSKCSGISLGKEISTGHNEWVTTGDKHGTQFQRDSVFIALHQGWHKDRIGSHIVRHNVIFDCEQTGICGHLGCAFSEIYDNHIFAIHTKRLFGGAEIGGIKLHAPLDVVISDNHVHNCDRGFWMDWQTQGTRITGNLMYDNDIEDIYIEVSHGPYVIDNNILLSMKSIKDMSHGGAYVNNLFGGFISMCPVPDRFTPYHFPHETAVAGVVRIMGGDNRFYNNIFMGSQEIHVEKEAAIGYSNWYHDGTVKDENGKVPKGMYTYDECPSPEQWAIWKKDLHGVLDFANAKLPMYCASNLYFGDATPYKHGERDSKCYNDINPQLSLSIKGDDVYLIMDLEDKVATVEAECITTSILGYAFESRARFENPDATPICIERDFFGATRPSGSMTVGPFTDAGSDGTGIRVGTLNGYVHRA
ncbi:MAG TPA: right-handed parallel beta-helix repeat-containing protein [Clostridiaceae bacterium]|nr:right-handed parallel beta-helix repeat-containing protein [Clostridiaceae bacterium]